jgi:small conductance mechanosensitive channel
MTSNIDVSHWTDLIVGIGLKGVGAIIVWVAGRWLIGFSMRLLSAALTRQHVETTLIRYLISFLTIALNVVLVVAILGYFGLETTSFAALLAAAGVAIGAAWAGLLSNFAAGAFLLMFRPFKVGDYILAGGVEGTVHEIGLFTTTIITPDNVVTVVGNTKIFADNIKNYSTNPYRRVELVAQLAHSVDPTDAAARLKSVLARSPTSRSLPSMSADRSSQCAPTAATPTTGKCTSIPMRRSAAPSPGPLTPFRRRTSSTAGPERRRPSTPLREMGSGSSRS